uniref:Uncharacterized protein n=1 Tax=Chromera velia CCMP2878 TaxID=1169474 RepID=A0A0G4FYN4_9ALVE|eukprot:Cvel_19340.t1-p1 / transcript=Cvel_19340.t1 / gene=Cvel_19340 / organism=Chromera_velia_CCMP2878 / gene_product=hypothetical protein / transcript_product=hypothetical protein / location=Cvel_scaffold1660:39065-39442(-) / protein_length=126 / sequence_SO=supercontig / SO=protein_coding / is_pseudo=false
MDPGDEGFSPSKKRVAIKENENTCHPVSIEAGEGQEETKTLPEMFIPSIPEGAEEEQKPAGDKEKEDEGSVAESSASKEDPQEAILNRRNSEISLSESMSSMMGGANMMPEPPNLERNRSAAESIT